MFTHSLERTHMRTHPNVYIHIHAHAICFTRSSLQLEQMHVCGVVVLLLLADGGGGGGGGGSRMLAARHVHNYRCSPETGGGKAGDRLAQNVQQQALRRVLRVRCDRGDAKSVTHNPQMRSHKRDTGETRQSLPKRSASKGTHTHTAQRKTGGLVGKSALYIAGTFSGCECVCA